MRLKKNAKKELVKATKQTEKVPESASAGSDDFSAALIKQLNKEAGSTIAFNLGMDSASAPTDIKRWISTGSRLLDGILSNRATGGLPEGRIVEVQGPASSGKSHLCFEVAKSTQKLGGIVVYIDTENATNIENLETLGINIKQRFVFVQTGCTEEIFTVAESTILKARAMTKDVPVTIIWDSIAASSPKAELEGNYDQNTIGLQARVLGKGLRKIANIIGNQNVLFLLINQQRMSIGVTFGDPIVTPGGAAVPYASSIRLRITSTGQSQIKDKNGNIIGIKVKAKTIKNKVARPFRECEFQIHFGKGIIDHEETFDLFNQYFKANNKTGISTKNGDLVTISGDSAWKNFLVTDKHGEVKHDIKFYKADFKKDILDIPEYHDYLEAVYEAVLVWRPEVENHPTFTGADVRSLEERNALKEDINE